MNHMPTTSPATPVSPTAPPAPVAALAPHVSLAGETPLEMPTFGKALMYLGRALRRRCPHCGEGRVLGAWGKVLPQCSACHYHYERSGPGYFTAAMFCNFLIAEFLFATSFASAVLLTWPNVPWDAMTWIAAAGAVIVPTLLYPFSKVAWLTIDTLVRPAMPDELTEISGVKTI